MKKTITLNEKEMTFKSSAATNILYKKAFGDDIIIKLTSYTKNLKELKNMQERIAEIRADSSKTQEEILAEMQNMMNSEAFVVSQTFTNETFPKLAYIMWLEANESQREIFNKLNEEGYLAWLMEINQDDLLAVTGQVLEIWREGSRTTSKPKN